MRVMEWIFPAAVYLDYASAIQRYGKIECGKHGIDNPSAGEIRNMGRTW